MASQRGEPRPEFKTEEGGSTLPEGDKPWWLTDLQQRRADDEEAEEDDKQGGDEDGPPESEPGQQRERTDSDPPSDGDAGDQNGGSVVHLPIVAWRR